MRIFTIYALVLLFLLSMLNTAKGGTRDPETPDEKHLEFGKKFIGVLKIRADVLVDKIIVNGVTIPVDKDNPLATVTHHASAVAISPHWILTAAHVIENTRNQIIDIDGTEFPLQAVFVHPKYETDVYGYYDIALGYSSRDLGLDFYTQLHDTDDELGQHATIAGFGWHGTFATGAKEYDGKRRAGSNRITEIERGVLICDAVSSNKTALEYLICPGDSGGGLFIGNKLAGINSFLIAEDKKPNGTYTDMAAFTRISLHTGWLQKQIAEHELKLSTVEK
jgi:hypothetical protein